MVKGKRRKTQLQKKPNGDTAVYVRCNPEIYAVFEALHAAYISKHMVNPKAFGVGSMIRDLAMRQANREVLSKSRKKGR